LADFWFWNRQFSLSCICTLTHVSYSFITPSIFDQYSSPDSPVVDEHSLCQKLGKDGCLKVLEPHWDNFVQEADFEKIKDAGFNIIRIPVGYWAFLDVGEGYTSGQVPYLDRAIGWARNQGLKVIVDLHGAPKSQNGFDHSGQKMGQPQWGTGDSIYQTHEALWQIYQKYGNESMQDVVIGIQPLNEPLLMVLDNEMVKQFYRDAFFTLRETSDTVMVLHDGFLNPEWMNNFLTTQDNGAQGVAVDHHEYTIFNDALTALSVQERQTLTCNTIDNYRNSDKWTIVGEWSGAVTDCAPHLNGYNQKSRFESQGVGNCWGKSGMVKYWSQDYKDDIRRLYVPHFQYQ
jgi:glucan 1,3-beta-glucosidase